MPDISKWNIIINNNLSISSTSTNENSFDNSIFSFNTKSNSNYSSISNENVKSNNYNYINNQFDYSNDELYQFDNKLDDEYYEYFYK